ncbi:MULTISPECIES: acyl carrier protein [Bacillus amyloliquefaciens group]|uniref:acyl carrier protein n=1 Tax=Bacillus amyloliquefaciens group TaxID=1938374 RepID=UPI000744CDB8|nr:hypothetical protein CEG11_16625 [Bacillus velezensis]QGT57393.1 hypothetical protein GL331_02135 [Bacillus velezensis]CUX95042.1 protein of unknown function [Bacillus velezensis]
MKVLLKQKNTFESEVTDILESITFIKIIVAIEKTYGFEFDDDMLLLSEFPTIGSHREKPHCDTLCIGGVR